MYSRTIDQTAAYLNSLSIPSLVFMLPYECPTTATNFDAIKAHYDRVFPKIKQAFEGHNVRVVDSFDTWIKAAKDEDRLKTRRSALVRCKSRQCAPQQMVYIRVWCACGKLTGKGFPQLLGAKTESKTPVEFSVNDVIPPDIQMQQGGNKVVWSILRGWTTSASCL